MQPKDLRGEPAAARVGVIIPAAGRGTRMGPGRSKVLASLAGVPAIVRAARTFADTAVVTAVVVAANAEDLAEVRATLGRYEVPKIVAVIEGGATRQASVILGFGALPPCDIVLVHDGARPLVSAALIDRVLTATARNGAAVPVVPMQDTVKQVRGDRVAATLDRRALARAQTPQGFRAELLRAAFERARDEGFEGTDESALVERYGAPVWCVPGCHDNVKITTPEDLVIAEALLKWRRG